VQQFKWRFQLLMVLLVLFASSVLTGFYIYEEEKNASRRAETSAKYIQTVYHSVIDDLDHTYKYRAFGNLLISGFKEALIAQDREKIYALTEHRYKTMQDENGYLKIMQFHAPSGISILRVHEKEKYGDNIAAKRPLVKRVHTTKKIQSGFEGGIAGVAYRVIVPYFDDKRYIGAVEFGVDINYISKYIQKTAGLKSLFLLHESRIAAASSRNELKFHIGKYYPVELEPEFYEVLKIYSRNNPKFEKKILEYDDRHYEIVPIRLVGDDGKEMGLFLCINDISDGYHDITQTILGSLVITALLVVLFLGINESVARMFMKKVRFQEEYIETILNSLDNIIVVTDGRNIVYVNNAFLDYLHYRSIEAFKDDYECICYKFESSETERYLQPEMDGMRWTKFILVNPDIEHKAKMTVDGISAVFSVHVKKLSYEMDERYVVVFTDVTQLNRLATLDQLTQVPNRFEFDKVLAHALSVSQRYKKVFSILLLDIDYFKNINDTYGHLVGDEVLKSFSALLKQQIRDSDVVARWGGEEFTILLPNTTLDSARKMAESLRQRVEIHSFGEEINITCSIGVAQYMQGDKEDSLLKRVDEHLYNAKNNGRNQVVS
jgi:diguanylate cyclase